MIGRKKTNSPLVEEFRISNTPVIGAYMFWRFAKKFAEESRKAGKKRNPHFLLFCFVSAIMADRKILNELRLKRSISSFRRFLTGDHKGVLFDNIHGRVKDMLPYTMAALDIAYACGLLKMHSENGEVEPFAVTTKRGTLPFVSDEISADAKLAETLAKWFLKYENPAEVARKLEVIL